ncbi:testicular haploid expressed gene protein-like isoform X3 [Rissa tridactyla]|uniref:testicular haploid expressed gene protein-like isoform X3 n=1 Tax=Rissa tridactyla TaxID=75485 RepID=UPI0023BAAE44|nr:testicular haploid expressed gene protein-like isoform X3 [Rissa tridactyla]
MIFGAEGDEVLAYVQVVVEQALLHRFSSESGSCQPAASCYLSARSRNRIQELAEPKKAACANDLSSGWETMIWERPLLVDFGFPSDRLLKLSEPKKCQAPYLQQRPRQSPEWPVSPAALSYKASPRILELARPKVLHPEFLMDREVSKFAQEAIASPRTLELARAKRLHPDYVPLQDAEWPVTKAAKHAVATPRLVELAQPCKRPSMGSVQFNPDAFTVEEAAKKATCSARIQELARPIKR